VTLPALGEPASAADRAAPAQRSAPAAPIVSVEGIWKRFGATDVVRDLSFEVRAGELLGFLGPNGAGKTTAMRMILDIIRPDRGQIRVFGEQPGVGVQSRVGYLPEERGLYRDVPVVDTLTYFGALKGLSTREARRRARQLLEEVGLGEALRKKGAELSRGMHQKAQVVATILHEPDLLIVDEPFQGLDPLNSDLLRRIILAQRERGAAVIMSTHDMEEAQILCDRVLLIERGRRLLYGTVRDVRASFSDGAVVVRGEGIPIEPGRFKSVHEAMRSNGSVRFILRDGARPQDLFRELAATDVAVERFEVASPSLTEIFIRAVESDRRAGTPS
jgi:ABC-2 type transport system ATP-binding protein